MRVLVSGSSGLIGTALKRHLRSTGHEVVTLVRRPAGDGEHRWDPPAGRLPVAAFDGVDAVVNLCGAGIGDRRWTGAYKRELSDSRLVPTALLAETMASLEHPPRALLSGSAIGWYGPRGDEELTESSPPGSGFLAALCRDWEGATAPAQRAGIRVAHLRTGLVLTAAGGALAKQLPLFRVGLGGRFGSGRQWWSWITADDHVAAVTHLLGADVEGPVNLTAPHPVTNAEFTRVLAGVLRRPGLVPIPRFGPALLLGGELADALLYTGQRVVPGALQQSGFPFSHPEVEAALGAVLSTGTD